MKNIELLINKLEKAKEELNSDCETELEKETLYNIKETLRSLKELRRVQSSN